MSDFGDLSSGHELYPDEPPKPAKRDKHPLSNAARAAIRRKDRELTRKLAAEETTRLHALKYPHRDPDPRSSTP